MLDKERTIKIHSCRGDLMATKAARQRAVAKYDKTHTTGLYLKLNLGTDKDILDWLEAKSNKQGYIKGLIREDIKKGE